MGMKARKKPHKVVHVEVRLRNLPAWDGIYCSRCKVVYVGKAKEIHEWPVCPEDKGSGA